MRQKSRLYFIWVTSMRGRVDHAVTDEEMVAGMADVRNEYEALCGVRFVPAPMICGPRRTCRVCAGRVW
ncbi:hypothetical protein EV193_1045 [Herbihabitans rhizosphaerae]|uniref:Uncharacterized protein n=1 Tax=Herbihabitans rhizosphaerae TaxID=1872711 RepID=A0A4Q7KQV4_9PSEU|nr:hypothetical protein EV193_1045 [Herbihabitans rhizosphaerae]